MKLLAIIFFTFFRVCVCVLCVFLGWFSILLYLFFKLQTMIVVRCFAESKKVCILTNLSLRFDSLVFPKSFLCQALPTDIYYFL